MIGVSKGYRQVFRVSKGYRRVFRVSKGYRRVFRVSKGYRRVFRVSKDYRRVFRVSKDYRRVFRVSKDYRRVIGVSKDYRWLKEKCDSKMLASSTGVENLDSGVGVYAPDAEAYTMFAPLFDPIIEDYHVGFTHSDKHPPKDFGDVNSLVNVDPTGDFVISTRVRCGRSMEGYPFNPCLTEAQYKEMEAKVSSTLTQLTGDHKGTFYPLTGMSKEVQQQLIDDHFLFKEGDRFLQAANACRYWPHGRGIFHNDKKTFLVWCNEEDHLRIISMQMGGDLGEVYRRMVSGVAQIESKIPFSHHDRLGFLTFCPTNLGTTIRASVHIKVPKLAANKAKLDEVAAKYNLQVSKLVSLHECYSVLYLSTKYLN